uniref:Uncharacterized protein n=1 Tax=Rhizophora mucronata TaxID=61149 RepID=A0A2P2NTP3_RHIMU
MDYTVIIVYTNKTILWMHNNKILAGNFFCAFVRLSVNQFARSFLLAVCDGVIHFSVSRLE